MPRVPQHHRQVVAAVRRMVHDAAPGHLQPGRRDERRDEDRQDPESHAEDVTAQKSGGPGAAGPCLFSGAHHVIDRRHAVLNTQTLIRRNRDPVARRFATISTAISTVCRGDRDTEWRTSNAPFVSASPMRNATPPLAWCANRSAVPASRTSNVKRRFAAVLAIAVTASATVLAAYGAITSRSSAYSTR